MRPDISVVIPTHNQCERLRLVLAGLAAQSLPTRSFEVVLVADGCTDATPDVAAESAAQGLSNLRFLPTEENQGRSAARNLGIAHATGELVVFLDGDALPAPDLLEHYWEAHGESPQGGVLCGYQYCIPDLEYLQDPQSGEVARDVPIPSVLRDIITARRDQLCLSVDTVRTDFEAVHGRARPGGYPFEESAHRQEEAVELLTQQPESPAGWLGFIPHNGAAPAELLKRAEGFDEDMPFSEGWELAYRLLSLGAAARAVPASSYHLYHYHRFTDPEGARKEAEVRYQAIEHMAAKHRDPRVRLLYFWYAHLWPDPYIPDDLLVEDLLEFSRLFESLPDSGWSEYELVLKQHPSQFSLSDLEVTYETCA
jgi:glycosyltransferase involved in cell wall biosynthesis